MVSRATEQVQRKEPLMSIARVMTLATLVVLGSQSLKFVSPWYDNWQLISVMRESVEQAPLLSDAAVVNAVLTKTTQLHIPLAARDIHLERPWHGGVRLWAVYEVTYTFPLGVRHVQRFRPEVQSDRS